MERKTMALAVVTALAIMASGCTDQSANSNQNGETTAQKWCTDNDHGNASAEGCVTEEETLQSGGIFYNTTKHCSQDEGFACTK